jgi:hypothetical protein
MARLKATPHPRGNQMTATILTKDAVTLYDIATNTVWDAMSVRDGERDVQDSYEIGDTVQEYETTDRAGNPLRVVFQIDAVRLYSEPDQGGVYVFPLPA